MKYIVAALVIAVIVAFFFRNRRAGHPTFKALDVTHREDRSPDAFYRAYYAESGVKEISIPVIREVLEAVSKATGLPAGKLEPADELGAIAAANGLQRAFLVAHLGNEFPEAEKEMMQKMAAGEFTQLHHAIALVVNARVQARRGA
jgi:hypothetical protein